MLNCKLFVKMSIRKPKMQNIFDEISQWIAYNDYAIQMLWTYTKYLNQLKHIFRLGL